MTLPKFSLAGQAVSSPLIQSRRGATPMRSHEDVAGEFFSTAAADANELTIQQIAVDLASQLQIGATQKLP